MVICLNAVLFMLLFVMLCLLLAVDSDLMFIVCNDVGLKVFVIDLSVYNILDYVVNLWLWVFRCFVVSCWTVLFVC